jgi:hypothetical protein
MTHPLQPTPFTDNARLGVSFPPDLGDPEAAETFLRGAAEPEMQKIAMVVEWLLNQPRGRTLVWAVLTADDDRYLRAIVRQEIAAAPVPPHTHKAKSVVLTTLARSMGLVGAIIGAILGLLIGLLIADAYSITSITFGDDDTAVTWVKTAIVATVTFMGAVAGGLIGGRKKERTHTVGVELESETISRHVPDAKTAQG